MKVLEEATGVEEEPVFVLNITYKNLIILIFSLKY